MPERPTGRAPRLRAGRGLRSLRPRAQKVVETSKLVMALPTSRYGSKVSRNLGGFFRNNETKLGWVLNETWTRAKPERVRLARRLSCCGRQPAVPMTSDARRRPGRTVRRLSLGVCV